MGKKKILIIGGGLSGLAVRHYIARDFPNLESTLLEKEQEGGGLLGGQEKDGFFFERAARIFTSSRSHSLLEIIREMGLESELLFSDTKKLKRYLLYQKKLIPLQGKGFFFSTFFLRILPALFTEWIRSPPRKEEESIYEFAARRLGPFVAENLFDPLTLGIYGGSIRKLSLLSTFPQLHEREKMFGSLTAAFFSPLFGGRKAQRREGFFTLKSGMKAFIERLIERGRGDILFGKKVERVEKKEKWVVSTAQSSYEADCLCSALSGREACSLFSTYPPLASFFSSLSFCSLRVIHLGFYPLSFSWDGLGYLVPSGQKADILGAMVDSSIFPQQNRREQELRITVFMGGASHPHILEEKQGISIEKALSSVREHLQIKAAPCFVQVYDYPDALPQYEIGHKARVELVEHYLKKSASSLHFVGNYLHGVGVEECLFLAKKSTIQLCTQDGPGIQD